MKTREKTMFPKLNMMGDTKAMRNGIIAAKPLFEMHHNQGNNIDEHEAGVLFIHEEEERQSKHNQKPEERSS